MASNRSFIMFWIVALLCIASIYGTTHDTEEDSDESEELDSYIKELDDDERQTCAQFICYDKDVPVCLPDGKGAMRDFCVSQLLLRTANCSARLAALNRALYEGYSGIAFDFCTNKTVKEELDKLRGKECLKRLIPCIAIVEGIQGKHPSKTLCHDAKHLLKECLENNHVCDDEFEEFYEMFHDSHMCGEVHTDKNDGTNSASLISGQLSGATLLATFFMKLCLIL